MKINEIIVVEGKHDMDRLNTCVEADIVYTHGTHLSKDLLKQLKVLNQDRGIIVFTDPDGPGGMIRQRIIDYVGTCKHASLSTMQAKQKGKVGIEHASCDMIIAALENVATYDIHRESLSWHDFIDCGLSGLPNSQERRKALSTLFYFPVSNAKTTFKYLNMMGITLEDILKEGDQ